MPTARELLEQADALMRRNRGSDAGIPVLTDAIPDEATTPPGTEPSTRERTAPAFRGYAADARAPRERAERNEADWLSDNAPVEDAIRAGVSQEIGEQAAAPAAAVFARDADAFARNDDVDDLEPPLLTDVVDERAVDLVPLPSEVTEGDPSVWLGADTIDPALHSITGPAPDTIAVVPPVTFRSAEPQTETVQQAEERDPTITRTLRAAGSEPTPPPTGSEPTPPPTRSEPTPPPTASTPPHGGEIPAASTREPVPAGAANDEERWRALAEQISMQVLQRLDLFIDTGLKTQLASHLQPIVARASAELVETINAHVGQLVQTYIAEAIEREIAHWRKQQK
ncbi:MAG TPA: hypothetical protein VF014_10860 [Casimicrobiaceae bacterium]|nr:hypothetical protein [Casimicrobiaceae bacterium]